jgi:hypothetical protein
MINDKDKKIDFTDKFLNEFVNKGFGVLSKRETELLVFHLLSDLSELDSKSNYEVALSLKITPTKVKNFRFERRLRYSPLEDEQIKTTFIEGLRHSNIKVNKSSKWIILSIEDSYIREAIKAKMKKLNHFSDSSFNSELISLDFDAFSALMTYYYNDMAMDEVVDENLLKQVKELLKDDSEQITMKSLTKAFVEGAAQKAGEGTISAGLSFLTGGVSDINIIIKKIKELLPK